MNEMKLEVVEENIMSSSTYDIRFNKDEGKVYNLNVVQKGYALTENTGREESTISLKFGYKKTYTSSFGTSYSLKLGAKTSVVCSVIPLIVEGKIEYTADSMYETHWEQTMTTETFIEVTYTAKMPANKKVTVTLEATEGMCDVPFSYTRRDILCSGKAVVHNMEDGIYKGVNLFNFNFKSNYEPLPKGHNEKIEE
ncbi:uncharacterized protein LOC133792517 [Humulus lupulus]|uniref:uncharacterized protein LOC133792517 n=1 Tax=Humulus lupulus TaxID=3486 RepID=UPI002B402336|nr:uncharacterized protein LOC133792517 [Humulus lupulus]